jgi:hypothetical protein
MALIEAIVPIFSLILLGWVARRFSFISDRATSILNSFAFYFSLPALFFTTLYLINFNILLNAKLLLSVILPMLAVSIVAFAYATAMKKDRKTKAAYILCSFLGQNAYLAIPLVSLAYGAAFEPLTGLIGALYFSIGMGINIFSLERFSARKTDTLGSLINVLKVPTMWGILLGFAFSILSTYYGIKLPLFVANTLSLVAAPASAVALFSLGTFMYRKSRVDMKEVLTLCFFKNFLLPAISFIMLFFVMFGSIDSKVVLLQAAMPMAVTNFVLAEKYNTRRELVANSIIISTLISLFTLSILITFLV